MYFEAQRSGFKTYENKEAALCDGAVDHIAFDVVDIEEAYKFDTGLQIKILTEIHLPSVLGKRSKNSLYSARTNLERLGICSAYKNKVIISPDKD